MIPALNANAHARNQDCTLACPEKSFTAPEIFWEICAPLILPAFYCPCLVNNAINSSARLFCFGIANAIRDVDLRLVVFSRDLGGWKGERVGG